jgi:dTDP-4-dehydrorhamnose reductase
MRKLVIIGANGQLGTDLIKELTRWESTFFDSQVIPLTHKDIEICDHARTRGILTRLESDVVINMAAYHRVDECEDHPEKTFQVNTIAVRNLALVCRDLDAVLVHMSTDYVFGGDQIRRTPYTEDALPWPLNVYGVSKLGGEYFVRNLCPKYFIVRSSGLYGVAGSSGKGGNFVELMLRLAREGKPVRVVNDQRLTPTYTVDLASKIAELVQTEHYGVYHITNSGDCTWYEFAIKIFGLAGLSPSVSPTTTEAFGAKATRPGYSVLAHKGLAKAGLEDTRRWEEALAAYLQERG